MTRRSRHAAECATDREVGVVAAVLASGSEKAAAHRLGLSHSTVKHHLASARSKVGATTTAQLVWILAPRLPDADGEAHRGAIRCRAGQALLHRCAPLTRAQVSVRMRFKACGAPEQGGRRLMNEIDERVNRHYGWSGLMQTIEEEIRRNGIDPARVTVDELAPVDNYHWHRLAGTLALARTAGITAADNVLDVGGGIGGPARQLAQRYGCRVTVLDLTAEYCAVGETLTAWTNLEDQVSFVCGNALAMPFPDGSFDVVWTQHASMNIADKAGLYREMARVIRVGGRLAFFDVLAGPNQPIHFPVPWASDPSFNFLLAPEETRRLIAQSGFREIAWMAGEELEAELERSDPQAGEPSSHPALNPGLLNGPDGPQMGANVGRNSQEGRFLPALGVYERI